MEVMTDVLVGWVQMSRHPSCFVSKAVARARSATGRLTKIVGHHKLRLRGLPGGRTGGRESDRGLIFLPADFVIPNPAPSAPASPVSGRTVQSSRKRGVIEVVGDFLVGWVGLPRAQAEALLASNSSSGLKPISKPVAIGEAAAPARA